MFSMVTQFFLTPSLSAFIIWQYTFTTLVFSMVKTFLVFLRCSYGSFYPFWLHYCRMNSKLKDWRREVILKHLTSIIRCLAIKTNRMLRNFSPTGANVLKSNKPWGRSFWTRERIFVCDMEEVLRGKFWKGKVS